MEGEKDAVVVDFDHSLHLCGERMKMWLPLYFQSFFAHPKNSKGLAVFYIFQGLIHIFKEDFT